jgi:polyisoprenoid-binding protein YceI
MKKRLILAAIASLAACDKKPATAETSVDGEKAPAASNVQPELPVEGAGPIAHIATEAPAGAYVLDRSHASLVFSVNHIGFSDYVGAFERFDARLQFDPTDPSRMSVTTTIDPSSLDIPAPPEGFLAELLGPQWLNAGAFPEMTFTSTAVELTAPDRARVTGDFSMNGVVAPVTLEVRFNGGYKGLAQYDPNARIGFSASGTLNRSVFNVVTGLPAPGSKMGVGDTVRFQIEAEFTGPPLE